MSDARDFTAIDADAGLFQATYLVPGIVCRTVLQRLDGGGWLAYSPGACLANNATPDGQPIERLVAPNSFHHVGLPKWQAAWPDATAHAAPGALKRLRKKGRERLSDLDGVRARLHPNCELIETPHTRIGETWLVTRGPSGTTWVVCDGFFNLKKKPKKLMGRILNSIGAMGPGLTISRLYRLAAIKKRRAYKAWLLERIEADQPTQIGRASCRERV